MINARPCDLNVGISHNSNSQYNNIEVIQSQLKELENYEFQRPKKMKAKSDALNKN
jgi:hypothetical protein